MYLQLHQVYEDQADGVSADTGDPGPHAESGQQIRPYVARTIPGLTNDAVP